MRDIPEGMSFLFLYKQRTDKKIKGKEGKENEDHFKRRIEQRISAADERV